MLQQEGATAVVIFPNQFVMVVSEFLQEPLQSYHSRSVLHESGASKYFRHCRVLTMLLHSTHLNRDGKNSAVMQALPTTARPQSHVPQKYPCLLTGRAAPLSTSIALQHLLCESRHDRTNPVIVCLH